MDVDNMKKQIQDAFDRENNRKSLILCCSCFRMDKRAAEAFSLMCPNEILPPIVKGRDRIYKLSQELNNDHIKAISKLSGRYAYYVKLENSEIVEEYNLITGARIR